MPQTGPELTPLETRKQLLLAESEANRMLLSEECRIVHGAVSDMVQQARSGVTLASSASLVVAGWAAFRRFRHVRRPTRPSWIPALISGLRVGVSLWLAHRSRAR